MRIVFLDIDGVLNSETLLREKDAEHRSLGHHEQCECYRLERMIDRACVARLNRLVAETNSKVVISSSWRLLMEPTEIKRVLAEHGLAGEIIGETPDLPNEIRETPFEERVAFGPHLDSIERGHEIDEWMKRNPGVERFVILDDCSDMAMHKNRHVQTDEQVGLTDEDVQLAINMMSWDGKLRQ